MLISINIAGRILVSIFFKYIDSILKDFIISAALIIDFYFVYDYWYTDILVIKISNSIIVSSIIAWGKTNIYIFIYLFNP